MSKYEVDVWEYADEFKNLDTNETFGGYAVCELLEQKDQQIAELQKQLAEKDKEISNLNGLVRERDKQIKNLKTNKKRVIEHKNKTKISFALEQLEKVKENIKKVPITDFDLSGNFEKMYKQDAIRQIAQLQNQLEEKEKDNQFLKKMYLSEKTKNDNYHTEKYALDKPVEELRKIKLTPKEKEIYYKGFDNCERQLATHIAELQQELKSQPAEIVEKIRNICCIEDKCKDGSFVLGINEKDLDTILKEYQK